MKDLTFQTMVAVFEEIFGRGLFWAMAIAALIVGALFIYILIRDRGLDAKRFVRAELAAPVGAVGAVAFVMVMTSSGLRDIGGSIDLIILLMIGVAGGAGLTLLTYLISVIRR